MTGDKETKHVKPRMGRMGYLNVLPIYHALESGVIPHCYELIYGPPAELNMRMAAGEMLAASTSCVEYARRPERYLLLPDLAIGSNGPVQSVLLLSRRPIDGLGGQRILVSAETHTSAALLRLLLTRRYGLGDINCFTGSVTAMVASGNPPVAFLAIGDEALRLRHHPLYPYFLDLGDAWTAWTGLPFIFGVWVADRHAFASEANSHRAKLPAAGDNPGRLLSEGRDWGLSHMDIILDIAAQNYPNMTRQEHADYFAGLSYSLGERERAGLRLFWEKLAQAGEIPQAPDMEFFAC
ncbi:MAG: menaquinone biosynthesis protein [Desulfovibrio sp.]|jgi:chorismate dehydratase|nr:menaquinone biosynthesis protein [Desulfovibrio sp.]